MQTQMPPTGLPQQVLVLLDGSGLERKTHTVVQVATAESTGGVRQALLSVGEVLAVDAERFRLLMYATSRTTAALTESQQGLLTAVTEGRLFRVRFRADRLAVTDGEPTPQAIFAATVESVEEDAVGYARILHGIEYQLEDESQALRRWERQLQRLREVDA